MSNPYEIYDLKRNPFPFKAIASLRLEDIGPFVPFKKGITKNLEFLIKATMETKRWIGIPLVGPIGSGKTRLLIHLKDLMKKKYGKKIKCIIIENPGLSLREFYSKFITELIETREIIYIIITKFENEILKILKSNFRTSVTSYLNGESIYLAGNLKKTYEDIKNTFIKDIISDEDVALSLAILSVYYIVNEGVYSPHINFSKEIDLTSDYRAALDFLKGKKISERHADRLGYISRQLSDPRIANYSFASIIKILKLDGTEVVFLFVDQFEKIIEKLSKKDKLDLLDSYRSLIDNNLFNFSAIFGCTTESWVVSEQVNPSFADRFNKTIEIPKIDIVMAKNLVKKYSDLHRISKKYIGTYFPFNEKSIRKILEESDSIRDFLENCFKILYRAAHDKEKKITENLVSKFIRLGII